MFDRGSPARIQQLDIQGHVVSMLKRLVGDLYKEHTTVGCSARIQNAVLPHRLSHSYSPLLIGGSSYTETPLISQSLESYS